MKYFAVMCLTLFVLGGCGALSTNTQIENISGKRLALTYDDAPRGDGPVYRGIDRTNALIDQLKDAKAGPAAFFVTTRGLDKPEGRARMTAYAQAGHIIANHSDTHMWASQTATHEYIADIDRAEAKLADFPNKRSWFRFPYLDEGGMGEANSDLAKRDSLREALAARELMNGYVTIDTFDWHLDNLWNTAIQNGQDVDMQALSNVYTDMVLDAASHYDRLSQQVIGRRPAHVLLLHENDLAAHFTKDLVSALRENGWTIVDPDEAYGDPISTQIPQTGFLGKGRIAALAADSGLRGADVFNHWSVSEEAIDARVGATKVFTKKEKVVSVPQE